MWQACHLGGYTAGSGLEVPHGWLAVAETRVRVRGTEHVQPTKSWRGRRRTGWTPDPGGARRAPGSPSATTPSSPARSGIRYGAHRPGYVLADAFGEPVPSPPGSREEFRKIVKAAGLPPITFYALRATMNTELAGEGIGVAARARSLGHGEPVNLGTLHARGRRAVRRDGPHHRPPVRGAGDVFGDSPPPPARGMVA